MWDVVGDLKVEYIVFDYKVFGISRRGKYKLVFK